MSTSLPSQFAIALGLAALGRKIILVRENNETTEKRRAAMFAELMDRGYEWLQYDRTRDVVRCDNNEGCVMFVSPSEPLERFGGLEVHHVLGISKLPAHKAQVLMSRARLAVSP